MKDDILKDLNYVYKTLVRHTSDVIWIIDLKTMEFIYVSEGIEKLAGIKPEQAVTVPLNKTVTPGSYRLLTEILEKEISKDIVKQRDKLKELELEMYLPDGSTIWVGVSMAFVRNKQHLPIGVVGIARDISDRMTAETALERSNKLYSLFIALSPNAIFLLDKEGTIINANAQAAALAKQKVGSIIGKNYSEFLKLNDPKIKGDFKNAVDANGWLSDIIFNFTQQSGDEITVEVSTSVIKDANDNIDAYLVVCRDITAQLESKKAIAEFHENITALLNATNDAAMLVDTSGKILSINEIALIFPISNPRLITGKTPNDIIGTNVYDYLPQKTIKIVQSIIQEIIATGTPNRSRFEWQKRFFDFTIFPVSDSQGTVNRIAVFGRDITMQKKAETALHYQVEFERIITTISSGFINLLPNELENGINEALGTIGSFENVDRVYLIQADEMTESFICTNEWTKNGFTPISSVWGSIGHENFEWATNKIIYSEILHIKGLADIPESAVSERAYFQSQGIKSLIAIPMISHNTVIGMIGMEAISEKKIWTDEAISLLKMVSTIFVNTMDIKKAERELLEVFMSRLSEREIQLLEFFTQGYSWPDDKRTIAKKMDVLPGTLDKFLARIREKINIDDFQKLVKISKLFFMKKM